MLYSILFAAVVAFTRTEQVGDVAVSCDEGAGWTFSASAAKEDGAETVTVSLSAPNEYHPPKFDVDFRFSGADVHHVWSTDYSRRDMTLWPGLWTEGKSYVSQLAREAPLLAALNANDRSRLTMAASEAFNRVNMRMYVDERTCEVNCGFTFFTEPSVPVKSYQVKIRIDRRDRFWADSVRDASGWISRVAGLNPAPVPEILGTDPKNLRVFHDFRL